MTVDPFTGVDADPRTVALAEMMSGASALVAPADSGHDIEIAAAFYDAAASVIGGTARPRRLPTPRSRASTQHS